jgi:hypothetical protein
MKSKTHIIWAATFATLVSLAAVEHALACGSYGPPPMSQTMFAALSDDARVAASAIEKMRQQGAQSLQEVKQQQRWLPMQIRQLDYTIAHFEKFVATDSLKLTAELKTKYQLRITKLRLKRAEAKLRVQQLETLLHRLQWAIARSTVMA